MISTYRYVGATHGEEFAPRDSLHAALQDIADFWRCPFEALSTEQHSSTMWFVTGPDGEDCGLIAEVA